MELKCFPLLRPKTKVLIQRKNCKPGKTPGKPYHYFPQERLVQRLAKQLNMSSEAVREQIFKERLYLLRQKFGESEITEADV